MKIFLLNYKLKMKKEMKVFLIILYSVFRVYALGSLSCPVGLMLKNPSNIQWSSNYAPLTAEECTY